MQERARRAQAEKMVAQRECIQEAAGTGSSADELQKLADLHVRGYLNDQQLNTRPTLLLAVARLTRCNAGLHGP